MSWSRGLAAAALVLCIALPVVPAAASAKKGHAHPPRNASSRQLRGAMVTPNWSTQDTPFTITPELQRAEIASVAAMGGSLIRFHLDWSQLVPDASMRVDQGYQDRVDQVMAWAAAHHIKVILNLVGTPCWAPASGPSCPLTHDVMFSPPRPDIFQATTRYLLQRYPSLYAYEVWNEPNLGSTFWVGSPTEFAATVNAAVAGAYEAGVATKILAAGLFMDGSSYLQQLYDAGMHGQDGISLHPYSMASGGVWVNPGARRSPFRRAIENTHRVMLRNNDHGGLWLTEFGFATCPAQPHCLSDSRAATYLANSFRVAARCRYIKGLTAFSMRDFADPRDPNPAWDLRSGILHKDLSPKSAFRRVKSTLHRLRYGDKIIPNEAEMEADFDPNQKREPRGRWSRQGRVRKKEQDPEKRKKQLHGQAMKEIHGLFNNLKDPLGIPNASSPRVAFVASGQGYTTSGVDNWGDIVYIQVGSAAARQLASKDPKIRGCARYAILHEFGRVFGPTSAYQAEGANVGSGKANEFANRALRYINAKLTRKQFREWSKHSMPQWGKDPATITVPAP